MTTARALTLLLAAQLVLALVTWWPEDRSALRPHPLLGIAADDVTSIAIAASPEEPGESPQWVELSRGDSGWVVDTEQGYPANPRAVDSLVERVVDLSVRQPIATSAAHHNDLNVGDEEYGRRVRIGTADGERELVIGAASSNSVHVRLADSDDVYVGSGLSEFAINATPDAYWNADYVQVPTEEISEIRVHNPRGDFRAVRGEAGWQIDGLTDDRVTDVAALETWLREVTRLRILRPFSPDPEALPAASEVARISWTIQAEDQTLAGGYALAQVADDKVLARADGKTFVVEVGAAAAEPLLEIALEDLVKAAPDEPPPAEPAGGDAD